MACCLFEKATLLLAHSMPLWKLKPRRARVYMEQQYRGDTGIIPSWEREYGAAIEALKESEWYSVDGMRTIGFKQRWLKMNKEWVMDELMGIWKENNGQTGGKERSKDDEQKRWLREWESGGGKEALLKQIAKALGLEENWDRGEDDFDPLTARGEAALAAFTVPTARRKPNSTRMDEEQQDDDDLADENNGSAGESDGGEEQLFSPPGVQRSGLKRDNNQQPNATTSSATKHRKHLMALSYRYFLAHLPDRCTHCSAAASPEQPLVFVLSFPLSTVLRRFYARRRRQAAVTARANGSKRLNREMIYERVSREQWGAVAGPGDGVGGRVQRLCSERAVQEAAGRGDGAGCEEGDGADAEAEAQEEASRATRRVGQQRRGRRGSGAADCSLTTRYKPDVPKTAAPMKRMVASKRTKLPTGIQHSATATTRVQHGGQPASTVSVPAPYTRSTRGWKQQRWSRRCRRM